LVFKVVDFGVILSPVLMLLSPVVNIVDSYFNGVVIIIAVDIDVIEPSFN
jgi:hypothetical protein